MHKRFLDGLDADLQAMVIEQIRHHWTFNSTAIEGNTLSINETQFVLTEGLTIKGKSIKDHNEVLGHARAIDLMNSMLDGTIGFNEIHLLHLTVQTEVVRDIYKPNGDWKNEPNGTWGIDDEGKRIYRQFSLPIDVPLLMDNWLKELKKGIKRRSTNSLIEEYAILHAGFVLIHPYWDGNGRMARLLSNIPLLINEKPPLVIHNTNRLEYINALKKCHLNENSLKNQGRLEIAGIETFVHFCQKEYLETHKIVDETFDIQKLRDQRKQASSNVHFIK